MLTSTDRPFIAFVSMALDRLISALDDLPPNTERAYRLRREKHQLERRHVPRQLPHARYDAQAQAWGLEVR